MKKILLTALITLSSTAALAGTADEMKEQSLQACKTQAEAMPEAQREMIMKICQCTVDNTDYEQVTAAQDDPEKMQELQKSSMAVAQKCSTAATS